MADDGLKKEGSPLSEKEKGTLGARSRGGWGAGGRILPLSPKADEKGGGTSHSSSPGGKKETDRSFLRELREKEGAIRSWMGKKGNFVVGKEKEGRGFRSCGNKKGEGNRSC